MNREQRRPYRAICRQVEREADAVLTDGWAFSLCHICRYANWSEADVLDGSPLCEHPVRTLRDDVDNCFDTWGGGDCWGFRPNGTLEQMTERLRETVEWQRELDADDVDPAPAPQTTPARPTPGGRPGGSTAPRRMAG